MVERPTIIIGSPGDKHSVGDGAANGGVKSQALWIDLLRRHGYDAYFVTYDGSQIQWLVKHPPVISVAQAKTIIESRPTRIMTTWMWSGSLFEIAPRYYLLDEELAFTSDYSKQRGLLEQHLAQGRIIKVGTQSRTQVGWYMAHYDIAPTHIQEWSDPEIFFPDDRRRVVNRIGYFEEDGESHKFAEMVRLGCQANGITVELLQVSGCESEVRDKLQTCDILLGMNQGKWRHGEGGGKGQEEAMHCGAVVVGFNIWGNTEFVLDGFTGYIVPVGRTDLMGQRVAGLLKQRQALDTMRLRSIKFAQTANVPEARWAKVREFLDLDDD